MCHTSCNSSIALTAARGTVLPVPRNPDSRRQSKMTFRPFRNVAKSARINLNKYWGLLSQSSLSTSVMKRIPIHGNSSSSSSDTLDYSEEMEQNRINEMLEAQAAAAISDNTRNSEFENSPDFQQYRYRRSVPHQHFRQNSVESFTSSWASSSSSSVSDEQYITDSMSHHSFIV